MSELLTGRTVLLVDDETEFTATLAERLELRGIRAVTARDATEALEFLQESTPDAAVLDILMPGMNGLDLLRHIKAVLPELPVVLLTGHGSTRNGITGMQLGAFDCLPKPIDIETLLKTLAQAMAGHQ